MLADSYQGTTVVGITIRAMFRRRAHSSTDVFPFRHNTSLTEMMLRSYNCAARERGRCWQHRIDNIG